MMLGRSFQGRANLEDPTLNESLKVLHTQGLAWLIMTAVERPQNIELQKAVKERVNDIHSLLPYMINCCDTKLPQYYAQLHVPTPLWLQAHCSSTSGLCTHINAVKVRVVWEQDGSVSCSQIQ